MDTLKIGHRIKYARDLRGMTLDDIADSVGVAKSTIQRYENGKIEKPKLPVLHSIANALNVNPSWLVCKSDTIAPQKLPSGVIINVLGRVAAGIPIDAIEEIIDTEEISKEMAATGEFFGLQIKGNSMEPKFSNGDVVIVRKQSDADDGDIVIALVNGDDAVCKRLKKYKDGIALISTNPSYEPMYFTKEDIEKRPVSILGKVKELRAKF